MKVNLYKSNDDASLEHDLPLEVLSSNPLLDADMQ